MSLRNKNNSILVKSVKDFSIGFAFGGFFDYLPRSNRADYPNDIEKFIGDSIFVSTAYFLAGVLHSKMYKYPFNFEKGLAQSTAFFTGNVCGRMLSSAVYSLMNN